jgi:hypothetical protein
MIPHICKHHSNVIFSQFYDIIQISILLLHHLYMLKKRTIPCRKNFPGYFNQPPVSSTQILVLTVALSSSPMIPPPLKLHFSLTKRSVTEFLRTPDKA